MKKLLLICGIVISTVVMSSCNKHEVVKTQQTATSQEAHWRTPNGYLIPYSEKDNWKSYLKTNLEENSKRAQYYKSQDCTLPNSTCNLECVSSPEAADCIRTSACAPCMNCCF